MIEAAQLNVYNDTALWASINMLTDAQIDFVVIQNLTEISQALKANVSVLREIVREAAANSTVMRRLLSNHSRTLAQLLTDFAVVFDNSSTLASSFVALSSDVSALASDVAQQEGTVDNLAASMELADAAMQLQLDDIQNSLDLCNCGDNSSNDNQSATIVAHESRIEELEGQVRELLADCRAEKYLA